MNCPNCQKTISQHDNFCRYCGKPVVAPPPSPPAPFRPTSGGIRIPIELNDFGPTEMLAVHSGAAWGAHIYTGHSRESGEIKERPEDCPEWVASSDWRCWFRRGLTVWDHDAQRIGSLLAGEALELLKTIESSDDWKVNGISIVERHKNEFSLGEEARPKRSRKKKGAKPEPPPDEPQPKPRFYEQERVRLSGNAAQEFYAYLHANEAQLRRMADEENALQQKVSGRIFEIMVKIHHDQELSKFDGTNRKFQWVRQEYPRALVCNMPPDRGTVTLSEDGFWWLPAIGQPGYFKYDYERFLQLDDALAWVEQKIPELRAQHEDFQKNWERERAEEEAKISALPRKDLTPYWIDPAQLEPERITYRAIIEVEYVPYSAKTREISFEEKQYYDEEFYTPMMVADQLKLSLAQVDATMPIESMGWYYFRSAVAYLQESVAAAATQRLWEQSTILAKFREKKVIRARYGYEEVETGYQTWLGQCESPEKTWSKPQERTEHMADLAMRETLLRALDVNGWCVFLQMSFKYSSDDDLLESMHKARAKSRYQSAEARAESTRWLAAHDGETLRPRNKKRSID